MKRERLDFKVSMTEKKNDSVASIDKPVYKRAHSRIGMGLNRLAISGSAGKVARPLSVYQRSEGSQNGSLI